MLPMWRARRSMLVVRRIVRSVLSAWCEATVIVCGRACIRVQPYSLGWMKLMPATLV